MKLIAWIWFVITITLFVITVYFTVIDFPRFTAIGRGSIPTNRVAICLGSLIVFSCVPTLIMNIWKNIPSVDVGSSRFLKKILPFAQENNTPIAFVLLGVFLGIISIVGGLIGIFNLL